AICSTMALLSACATTGVNNSAGRATVYEDVRTSSSIVQGIGIESQDIVAVTDRMMRDMLANQLLAGRSPAPRVIIDSQYFTNESSSRIKDRKSTRLNSSHVKISYAVFCLKKKRRKQTRR